jgi:hypothetical protein
VFRIAEYYRDIENVLNGLQRVLNEIVDVMYIIDSHNDKDIGELG